LHYRGEGGLKTLPKTLPTQLQINACGIDLGLTRFSGHKKCRDRVH
jgi:hypothetical protein